MLLRLERRSLVPDGRIRVETLKAASLEVLEEFWRWSGRAGRAHD
jgi:hypothetical protein